MLSLDEIKVIQLHELEYIDKLCRDNNLEYSLTYGTLIGAVRHKGFIPWDDDIDLMMRRDDYEKLIEILMNEERYGLIAGKANWFNWAKIIDLNTIIEEADEYNIKDYGVWLDIFPLDEVPNPSSFKGKVHMKLVKLMNTLAQQRAINISHAQVWTGYKRILWLIRHALLSIFPISFYNQITFKILTRYRGLDTGFVGEGNYYWRSPKRSFNKEIFDSYIDIPFESVTARSINDYDVFLTNVYGNYMKLPPIDQQKSVHHYKAYWKKEGDLLCKQLS